MIELMVVVAIIGLLVGVLMPALRSARATAKRTACAANLHQIGTAMQQYLGRNRDRFPYASLMPSVSPAPLDRERPIYLANVLLDDLNGGREVFHCPEDLPGASRPAPNAGLSYFETEKSSYEYRFPPPLGGRTIDDLVNIFQNRAGRTVPPNEIYILRDYNNFHAAGGTPGARRYLYVDGHVSDYEN